MLMIRLRRGGAKKKPIYRVVVSDSRKTPLADYLEQVGFYDPNQEPPEIKIDLEKVDEWQKKGAGVSDTVQSLIQKATKQKQEVPEA
jgi:small subunit ribosomal protein S16